MKANNDRFIQKVIELAQRNVEKYSGGPFAAVIVKKDKIISYGYNRVTSKNDPTEHAEINAIRKAAKKLKTFNLKGCVIYSSSQPCPMCFSAIYWANIKNIYYAAQKETVSKYGFKDNKIYKELQTNNMSVKMRHIKSPDVLVPFKAWRRKKDKIKY